VCHILLIIIAAGEAHCSDSENCNFNHSLLSEFDDLEAQ
jgi:hypothetical protein